ncbi:MAG: hypothetical protein HN904_15595, partial [Victivallales bacterium]|nr:hypothetical protein [Victivallales bacterium]
MGEALRIGWHEVDITPEQPIELCGQYYQRLSRGVHSRLKAVVWAVEQGGQAAVMVCVDLAGINRAFQDELRERLRGRLSVDPGNVIVNATHTHCGPSIA